MTDDDIQKALQHDKASIIYEAGFVMHIKVENVPEIVCALYMCIHHHSTYKRRIGPTS